MACEILEGTYKQGDQVLDVRREAGRTVVTVGGQRWEFNENGFHVEPPIQTPVASEPQENKVEPYVGTPWRRRKALTEEPNES